MSLGMVLIKPVGVVVRLYPRDYVDRLVEEEARRLMTNARPIGGGLYVIEEPSGEPTPSLLVSDCTVKALLKLRLGTVTNGEGVKWVAVGNVYHRLYQDWFQRVNGGVVVINELGIAVNGLRGRVDIFYELPSGGVGIIELKASYKDLIDPGYLERVKRQLAAYHWLLSQAGYEVVSAHVVTMLRVYPVSMGELRDLAPAVVGELRALSSAEIPKRPPKPELCLRCEFKPVCPSYQGTMTLTQSLGNQPLGRANP